MSKCLECSEPIYSTRYMRCKEHHEIKRLNNACVSNAKRVLENGSTPTAYKQWKSPKAWKWKAGVVYGRGRL